MLYGRHMLPTIPASDLARARAWYADRLGFTTGQEEAAALLYRSGEERVFLLFSSAGAGTAQHQLAAWVVDDLEAEVAELRARRVEFEDTTSRAFARLVGLRSLLSVRRPGSKTAKATCSPSLSSVTALQRLRVQGLVSRAVAVRG